MGCEEGELGRPHKSKIASKANGLYQQKHKDCFTTQNDCLKKQSCLLETKRFLRRRRWAAVEWRGVGERGGVKAGRLWGKVWRSCGTMWLAGDLGRRTARQG